MSYLPAPVQAILDLFQGLLADVRFADVDAAALAHSARAVEEAAAELAQREAQLNELRQALADRQEALLVLAQRGLAYARVYAENDDSLSAELARINLPKASKPRKANPKPTATESASPELSTTPESTAGAEPSSGDAAPTTPDPSELSLADSVEPVAAKTGSKGKRRSANPRDHEDADSAPA